MSATSIFHVTPLVDNGEWAVMVNEIYTIFPDEGRAIARAWELCKNLGEAEILVHDANGRVRSSLTIRQVEPPMEVSDTTIIGQVEPPMEVLQTSAGDEELDDAEDALLRSKAERITPRRAQLDAMIDRGSTSTIDYSLENDELPC
jgi:Uncharacterized protein conserved in bacteria (DUF2188)